MSTKNEIMTFILTVVVLFFVMGVFMAMASPDLQPQVQEARENVDKLNLKIINQAVQRYNLDQGIYPEHLEELVPKYLDEVPVIQEQGKKLKYKNMDSSFELVIE